MSQQQKVNNDAPIYAEIVEANDERTLAALVLFEWRIQREFRGARHLAEARKWVALWGAHFEQEWLCVLDANAITLTLLIESLKRQGVSHAVIKKALEGMGLDE